jgi:hypothetical protein
MLTVLKSKLEEAAQHALRSAAREMPQELSDALVRCITHDDHQELSLLACASAMWCGGRPKTGLPMAAATLMLRAGISAHMSLAGFREQLRGYPMLLEGFSDATTILCGDGLLALGIEHLAENCGLHSAELVVDAVNSLGAHGVLAGLSLEMSCDGTAVLVPDGRRIWEITSGRLSMLAAKGGAQLAGASDTMLDDAALAGLLIGRARFLARGGWTPSMEGLKGKTSFEATTLIEQAEAIVGHGPESALFSSIMYFSDFAGT